MRRENNGLVKKNHKSRKWKAGLTTHSVKIEEDWLVLDVGSGHNPHPRADVLLDFEVGNSIQRSGRAATVDKRRPFIIADACSMPFKDKSFDYILAVHIAEHVDDPESFCKELIRVGRRGYVETPSKLCEKLLGEPVHKFFVYNKGSNLVFEQKQKTTVNRLFYGLFYYGRERAGHLSITAPNKVVHLLLKASNYALLRLWCLWPIRRWMYTCFEWQDSFDFKVKS